MLPQTLTALACLLANKGAVDTSSVEAQLSQADKAQIEEVVESGACLPENLEKLIQDTNLKVQQGELEEMAGGGAPTFGGC